MWNLGNSLFLQFGLSNDNVPDALPIPDEKLEPKPNCKFRKPHKNL